MRELDVKTSELVRSYCLTVALDADAVLRKITRAVQISKYEIILWFVDDIPTCYNFYSDTVHGFRKYEDPEEAWRKEFGRKLKLIFQWQPISEKEVAERLGISTVSFSRYISGKSRPSAYIVYQLSKILNFDIEDMLNFDYLNEI